MARTIVVQPVVGLTVALAVHRVDGGTGSVLVSSGMPLCPGDLLPGSTNNVRVFVSGMEQNIYIEELKGLHTDGSLVSVLIQFNYAVNDGTDVIGELRLGEARNTGNDITKTTPPSEPLAVAVPSAASYLVNTNMFGLLTTAASTPSTPTDLVAWQNKLETEGDIRVVNDTNSPFHYSVQYDRALGWWTHWLRTGDVKWHDRAVHWAVGWRNNFAPSYTHQPFDDSLLGMVLHYWLTGDTASRDAVRDTATYFEGIWEPILGDIDHSFLNARQQSRVLLSAIWAWKLDTTITNKAWDLKAKDYLNSILSTQQVNGSWIYNDVCYQSWNFMTGLLCEALIKYYDIFDADSRIPDVLKDTVDYLWDNEWVPSAKAIRYASGTLCGGHTSGTPALNGYHFYPFNRVYVFTSNTVYRDRADELLDGTVNNAFWGTAKSYNQQIMTIGHGLYWRQQT